MLIEKNVFCIADLRSWWEVPSIAHFCSLFRTAFDLTDFDIEVYACLLMIQCYIIVVDTVSNRLNYVHFINDVKNRFIVSTLTPDFLFSLSIMFTCGRGTTQHSYNSSYLPFDMYIPSVLLRSI